MINIGQTIREELTRQGRSVSWLARKLNCNRAAVYRIMSKNSIDTYLLQTISVLLNRNFFADIYKETESELNGPESDVYHF